LVRCESFARSESHSRGKNTDRCAEKHRPEGPGNQQQDDDAVDKKQMHAYRKGHKIGWRRWREIYVEQKLTFQSNPVDREREREREKEKCEQITVFQYCVIEVVEWFLLLSLSAYEKSDWKIPGK
jgi:hypothetical protein